MIIKLLQKIGFILHPETTDTIRNILKDSVTANNLILLLLIMFRYSAFYLPNGYNFVSFMLFIISSSLCIFIIIWFLSACWHLIYKKNHADSRKWAIVLILAIFSAELYLVHEMDKVIHHCLN